MSPAEQKQFEVDRIKGMMTAKGYQISSSSIEGDKVKVKVERVFTAETLPTRDLEMTWLTNFLRSFGWSIDFTGYPDNRLAVEFSKIVP